MYQSAHSTVTISTIPLLIFRAWYTTALEAISSCSSPVPIEKQNCYLSYVSTKLGTAKLYTPWFLANYVVNTSACGCSQRSHFKAEFSQKIGLILWYMCLLKLWLSVCCSNLLSRRGKDTSTFPLRYHCNCEKTYKIIVAGYAVNLIESGSKVDQYKLVFSCGWWMLVYGLGSTAEP